MDDIKAIEVQISSVDDIEGLRFEDQLIEDPDIVNFAVVMMTKEGILHSGVEHGKQVYFVYSQAGKGGKK